MQGLTAISPTSSCSIGLRGGGAAATVRLSARTCSSTRFTRPSTTNSVRAARTTPLRAAACVAAAPIASPACGHGSLGRQQSCSLFVSDAQTIDELHGNSKIVHPSFDPELIRYDDVMQCPHITTTPGFVIIGRSVIVPDHLQAQYKDILSRYGLLPTKHAESLSGFAKADHLETSKLITQFEYTDEMRGSHAGAMTLPLIVLKNLAKKVQSEILRPFCAPTTPVWGMSHMTDVLTCPILARTVQATSKDADGGIRKTGDDNRVLYICLAAYLVVILCSNLIQKFPYLLNKLLNSQLIATLKDDKYLSLLLSFVKHIYKALKVAKEMNDIIKYYQAYPWIVLLLGILCHVDK